MATTNVTMSRMFAETIDTLVGDFDVIEVLTMLSHRCVALFAVDAVGILVGDNRGTLQVLATSSEQARLLELFQLQNDEGPCLECFPNGLVVASGDFAETNRWPLFGHEAQQVGFHSVLALPLRYRGLVIGTLNMFMRESVVIAREELVFCQALADLATVAILHHHPLKQSDSIHDYLRHAIDSRIAVEQAKGILAERFQVDMPEAFAHLLRYATDNKRQLSEVAGALVNGTLAFGTIALSNSARQNAEQR
jgi:GAF domain-containing protein